jgi:hypothetical protein
MGVAQVTLNASKRHHRMYEWTAATRLPIG